MQNVKRGAVVILTILGFCGATIFFSLATFALTRMFAAVAGFSAPGNLTGLDFLVGLVTATGFTAILYIQAHE